MPKEIVVEYPIDSVDSDDRRLRYFNTFVKQNYGDYAYVDKGTMTKDGDAKWVILGGVAKPYFILENGQDFPHLRYDIVKEAFAVQLSAEENDIHVGGISRAELTKIVQRRIKSKTNKYEVIVLNSVKDKLARIPQIQVSHTPIIKIIQNLDKLFDGNIDLTQKEFSKWNRYLPLLSNLEIINYAGEGQFNMGEAYKAFERTLSRNEEYLDHQKMVENLFGYIIQYGSQYLSEYLNLTASKPYITLTNTFYYYASKIGKDLGRDFKTSIQNLQTYYKEIYKRSRFYSSLKHWILQLQSVDILRVINDDVVGGNSDIYNKIVESLGI